MRTTPLRELVVCSLERFDEVWRRNQLLIAELLSLEPHLRVLFVEPPIDVAHELRRRRKTAVGSGLRRRYSSGDGRLWTLEPTKWLPRTLHDADAALARRVERSSRRLGFSDPLLWVNDLTYARLVERTAWRTLYDVTDDWLFASCSERELDRRHRNEALLVARAAEVVVCSPALARSKGSDRVVRLIPNAVDVTSVRAAATRPADLPSGRIVAYVGTLHSDRLDLALCDQLARGLGDSATLVFVGPDALGRAERELLVSSGNVVLLGARPHRAVAAYLQHADVLVAPHVVSAFTESLDPIKVYEYRAVGRPVVATPVAGFRDAGDDVTLAVRGEFIQSVLRALVTEPPAPVLKPPPTNLPTWRQRAEQMRSALHETAVSRGDAAASPARLASRESVRPAD